MVLVLIISKANGQSRSVVFGGSIAWMQSNSIKSQIAFLLQVMPKEKYKMRIRMRSVVDDCGQKKNSCNFITQTRCDKSTKNH